MDREQFEKELREKQQEHLEKVNQRQKSKWRPCLHDNCPECIGTGIRKDGTRCIHMISCPCPKCSPYFLSISQTKTISFGSNKTYYKNGWNGIVSKVSI